MGYTWAGSCRPTAFSCGLVPGRGSPTTGSGWSSPGGAGAQPPRRADAMASAPTTSVLCSRPAAISAAARVTNHWGVLPPMVVVSTWLAWIPSILAMADAGAGLAGERVRTKDRRSSSLGGRTS